MELPNDFRDLWAAYSAPAGTFVNIIGIVVDIMPPSITRTGEHMFTFKLLDQRLQDSAYGSQGLRVRFFVKGGTANLPKVRKHGDAVLLRHIKMQPFSGQPVALSNYQTGVLVFPAASIPDPGFIIAYQGTKRLDCFGTPLEIYKLSLHEQQYIVHLKHELSATIPSTTANASGGKPLEDPSRKRPAAAPEPPEPDEKKAKMSSFGQKFALVEEVRHRKFADICVEVVKKFPSQYGCELYVTDYTKNLQMFLYRAPEEQTESEREGDTYGYSGPPKRSWPGPYGFLVLKVEAKEPHASHADAKVMEGDCVLLRNVKMNARAEGGQLDGFMWPDHTNPEKVNVIKLLNKDVPEIEELLMRKTKYWKNRPSAIVPPETGQRKLTKGEKKKLKKKRLQDEAASAKAAKHGAADVEDDVPDRSAEKINRYVRCSHEEVPVSSLSSILDSSNTLRHTNTSPDGRSYVLPFVNAKYRARVRIIDFEPKILEDFSMPALMDHDKSEFSPDMDWELMPKYEWYFSLLLQDARLPAKTDQTSQIWVHVRHEEAQYLLGRDIDDPQDLRRNPQLLAKLREKLFVLWGNLEERGGEPLSNTPLELCIAESGTELDDDDPEKEHVPFGWKKVFRLFGTTIV